MTNKHNPHHFAQTQADPQNFEPQPMRSRRMTLPNPMVYSNNNNNKDTNSGIFDESSMGFNEHQHQQQQHQHHQQQQQLEPANKQFGRRASKDALRRAGSKRQRRELLRKQSGNVVEQQQHSALYVAGRKSIGSQPSADSASAAYTRFEPSSVVTSAASASAQPSRDRRKGSIAQVSISGVMRLSRKLSIKKWHSNITGANNNSAANATTISGGSAAVFAAAAAAAASTTSSSSRARASLVSTGSSGTCIGSLVNSASSRHQSVVGAAGINNTRDPVQLGQQILNAYLIQQRQRELEEEQERIRREELARASTTIGSSVSTNLDQTNTTGQASNNPMQQQQQHLLQRTTTTTTCQPIVKISSTRKSFRDFKHISRKIFMRGHSSNKVLQQTLSMGPTIAPSGAGVSLHQEQKDFNSNNNNNNKSPSPNNSLDSQTTVNTREKSSRRNILKIRRSETVFEATTNVSSQSNTSQH